MSKSEVKIILIAIVKNEEKIIMRMLDSVINLVSGICITDTGSTDTTVRTIEAFAIKNNKPCIVYSEPWQNFGYNRTISFNNAIEFCKKNGFDLNQTYGLLLDADMKLQTINFNPNVLTLDHYYIIQKTETLEYYNTRLIRLNKTWCCIGVTHEYWDVKNVDNNDISLGKLEKTSILIIDLGDGGSKGDKFTRDIQLLESGIRDEPFNSRYYFYLAQSYQNTKNYYKAIDIYTKCIDFDDWREQTWYCYYMISICWLSLNKYDKFVKSALDAFKFRPSRAESVYRLVNHFRVQKKYKKAAYYYEIGKSIPFPVNDILFIEPDIYTHLFHYEYTIIQYYINKNRLQGLLITIDYLNKYSDTEESDIVFNNMKYYMPRLIDYGKRIKLDIPNYKNFVASSISLIELHTDIYLANIRYVNYTINDKGDYLTQNNESIKTLNACVVYDYNFKKLTDISFMKDNLDDLEHVKVKSPRIIGIEDVRLFAYGSQIGYTASTIQYSYDDKIRIVTGIYDQISKQFLKNFRVRPPIETLCEKNLIVYKDTVIYKWYPLTLCSFEKLSDNIDIDKQLVVKHIIQTPAIFRYYNGSSNVYEWKGLLWTITHGVEYENSRKYFHQVVVMSQNFEIFNYSTPFYFDKYGIEYCSGLIIRNDCMYATVSSNDRSPFVYKIKLQDLEKFFVIKNYIKKN